MMRSDWGSVAEVKKGVWRIRYWADSENGYKRQSKTVRGTRRDANDALAALRLDHSKEKKTPTLNECWVRWLLPYYEQKYKIKDLSKNTLTMYKSLYNAHIKPRWGNYEVDAIRPISVQKWIDRNTKQVASKSLMLCKKAVTFAQRYEFCNKNVFDIEYIMPSEKTINKRSSAVWSLEELLGLLAATKQLYPWLLPSFILCAFAGCRVGESWAVSKDDIEMITIDGITLAQIKINKQIMLQGGTLIHTLKNEQSNRVALLPEELALYINSLNKDMLMEDENTKMLIPRNVMSGRYKPVWANIIARAQVEQAPYNRLRASWRTYMRDELEMPADMLEKMMGHKGAGVSNEHYYAPKTEVYAKTYAKLYAKVRFANNLGLFGTWFYKTMLSSC